MRQAACTLPMMRGRAGASRCAPTGSMAPPVRWGGGEHDAESTRSRSVTGEASSASPAQRHLLAHHGSGRGAAWCAGGHEGEGGALDARCALDAAAGLQRRPGRPRRGANLLSDEATPVMPKSMDGLTLPRLACRMLPNIGQLCPILGNCAKLCPIVPKS